ncbi:MFS general substrate transporter [Phlegmacium glaucopus]|nr:MFS general substrate transporter [Phlegmacium glaucopus]
MASDEMLSQDASKEPEDADCLHKEGTLHQANLGLAKPKRKHFFSQLDPASADAVHRDAETIEYSIEEKRVVKKKIDNIVLPLVICSGNAHVITAFNKHYRITDNNKWTLALSIFYLPLPKRYSVLNIALRYSFFLSLTFWGLASLSIVYAKGYSGLLALRVLLGIGEAGYYAGMIYYLSFWYKRSELAMRTSLCTTGTLPGAIGGLLAFGLTRVHTSVLEGWQFLFLVEAIPTLIMALMILFFLPSFPFSASFLTPRERAIAQARLNRDHKPQSHGGMTGWSGFKAVVADINSWLFMLVYASFNVGVATISYFLPTLIKDLGFSSINAQGLTVAPYVVGWFMVVFQSWHSDRTKDSGWHIMGSCAVSFIGYLILATSVQKSVGAAYFALFFGCWWSWAANAFSPTSKRGVGTAFIVSISNCVSIASPQVYFDPQDNFRKGHAISAGCLFLSLLVAFILRTRLTLLNKRNQAKLSALSENEKQQLRSDVEIWDDDVRYVFMT